MSFFRPTNEQQPNAMDTSGLMHLITTGSSTNVTVNNNDESIMTLPTNEQTSIQLPKENVSHERHQLPHVASSSTSLPLDTEQQTISTEQQTITNSHNISEIHRDMLTIIPIPQAWPHLRHQSGLFSYPDLPHFNVIRQATFRDGRFVCPFCTVDFASKEGIRYHLYNSCTKSPYPKAFFRCLMCGSELADRSSLRTHLARHVS